MLKILLNTTRFQIPSRDRREQMSFQQDYCTVGPTGQWFPRASPHLVKGHNKYIYTLCPTLTWHGKHKCDESCLIKETPEKRRGDGIHYQPSSKRPLESETATATYFYCHEAHLPDRRTFQAPWCTSGTAPTALVHSDHSSNWAFQELPGRWI